jgi:predicted DNA-binding protein YlxM (UPF0122 family)
MAYDPIYTHEDYLFEEVTIKGKKLQMIADENKVTRSCIYSYVKKFGILSEEYATDLNSYQKVQRIRREHWAKKAKESNKEPERRTDEGQYYREIERKVSKEGVKGEIQQTIMTDFHWTEEDFKKLDAEKEEAPVGYIAPGAVCFEVV